MDKIIQLKDSTGQNNLFPVTKNGIDTTNILYNQSGNYGTVLTYTTTQDCVVEWSATNGGSINGLAMISGVGTMYAKAGTTFVLNGGTTNASRSMRAFGLK